MVQNQITVSLYLTIAVCLSGNLGSAYYNLLWGSTVGYPSDILASCFRSISAIDYEILWFHHFSTKIYAVHQLAAVVFTSRSRAWVFTARCYGYALRRARLLRQVVCPSVTSRYRDHIGWKSIMSRLLSPMCLLFVDLNITDLPEGEHPEILTRIGEGHRKAAFGV